MVDKNKLPEIYLYAGMSGYGKTQKVVDGLDLNKPIMALDFRGQISEKLNIPPIHSREEMIEELNSSANPIVIYQPGFEDYEIEDDIDYFLTLAFCMRDAQIIIDEIDFELKPTEYPKSFRKLIASARTQNLTIHVTAHRLKECPLKMRALGKKVIFRIEEESDLEYLAGLPGFNKQKIMNLPRYEFIVLPLDK